MEHSAVHGHYAEHHCVLSCAIDPHPLFSSQMLSCTWYAFGMNGNVPVVDVADCSDIISTPSLQLIMCRSLHVALLHIWYCVLNVNFRQDYLTFHGGHRSWYAILACMGVRHSERESSRLLNQQTLAFKHTAQITKYSGPLVDFLYK